MALPKPTFDHCSTILDSWFERWGGPLIGFELMFGGKPICGLDKEEEIEVEGWIGFRLARKLKILKEHIEEWAIAGLITVV